MFGINADDDARTINDFDSLIGMLTVVRSDLAFQGEIRQGYNANGDADYMRGLLEAVITAAGIK